MKKYNTKNWAFTLLLTSSFLVSGNLHAGLFGIDIEKAKEKLKNATENATTYIENNTKDVRSTYKKNTVGNSTFEVSGVLRGQPNWIMYSIAKDSFTEVITEATDNGAYSESLALRAGPGLYTIEIYENATDDRYHEYTFVKTITVENTDSKDQNFLLPSPMVQSDDERIVSLAIDLTSDAEDQTDSVRRIHDYVAQTIKYDRQGYNDGSYKGKKYDAVSVLEAGVSVCAGYSNLFAALVRASGIRVKVVNGTAQGKNGYEAHAWNEVYLDGQWRSVDTTWDAGDREDYTYFLNEAKLSQNHQREKELPNY